LVVLRPGPKSTVAQNPAANPGHAHRPDGNCRFLFLSSLLLLLLLPLGFCVTRRWLNGVCLAVILLLVPLLIALASFVALHSDAQPTQRNLDRPTIADPHTLAVKALDHLDLVCLADQLGFRCLLAPSWYVTRACGGWPALDWARGTRSERAAASPSHSIQACRSLVVTTGH
jgi:hypothetical protein